MNLSDSSNIMHFSEKYITFEYDIGGWNNIRISFENIIVFALLMKRTIVLPPKSELYLLNSFSCISDYIDKSFFSSNYLKIISFDEYINRLPNYISKPNKINYKNNSEIYHWFRKTGHCVEYNTNTFFFFPDNIKNYSIINFTTPRFYPFYHSDNWINNMYIIKDKDYEHQIIHFQTSEWDKTRIIQYSNSKIYIESLTTHKFVYKFIRDYFKYNDEIRTISKYISNKLTTSSPVWHSAHIRRGDFQYKETQLSAMDILKVFKTKIPLNSVIYIATDEKNLSFFDILNKHYKIYYFNSFKNDPFILNTLTNNNFIGMIEQMICKDGFHFFGTYYSTFTHYIIRQRGYINNKNTWYTNMEHNYLKQINKIPCNWENEYPDSWENLN